MGGSQGADISDYVSMVNKLNYTYFNCFLPQHVNESDENTKNVENVDNVEVETSHNSEDVTFIHGLIFAPTPHR